MFSSRLEIDKKMRGVIVLTLSLRQISATSEFYEKTTLNYAQ